MKRTTCACLLAIAAAGCDRPATTPVQPEPAVRTPDNTAAQSIMQPKVIAEVEPTPTPDPTEAVRVTGVTIGFPDGTALDDAGRARLDALVGNPGVPREATWVLRGSSDSVGSDRANLASSRARAMAVRNHLIDRGIDAARISVIALGERRPVAPNAALDGSDDPAGRARNRRVDIEIIPPAGPAASPIPSAPASPATD